MTFKWDWDKRELKQGEEPSSEASEWDLAFVGALLVWGYFLVEKVMPFVGHWFFGGWL